MVHVPKVKKRLERLIENGFLQKLKKKYPYVRALKLNLMGRRSWPDRLLILPGGKTLFIEFKRVGADPTPLQEECHAYLRSMGHTIRVFDDENIAMLCVDQFMKEFMKGLR